MSDENVQLMKMAIGQEIELPSRFNYQVLVRRVPGGWLYTITKVMWGEYDYKQFQTTSTFVPM